MTCDDSTAQLHAQAVKLHKAGALAEAEAVYRRVLQQAPQHVDALHQLGGLLVQAGGKHDEALRLIKAAVQLAPGNARLRRSLGAVHAAAQQWLAAADAFQRAIEKQPADLQTHMQLARVLKAADRPGQAADVYRAVLKQQPDHPSAHYKLANVLKQLGRHRAAADEYREHLRLAPGHASASFWLAALTRDPATTSCPADIVAQLFDSYADHFDEHLTEKLQYRTPGMLMDAVLEAASSSGSSCTHPQQTSSSSGSSARRWQRCLDLGCGTGLMGSLLRGHVGHLAGVDLSAGMVARARARGCYDELAVGELVAHLQQQGDGMYNLLVAADVFVYIGDLQAVMAAAARVAAPGCVFGFSTEMANDTGGNGAGGVEPQQAAAAAGGGGFVLQATGRFKHAAPYLRATAAAAGWRVLLLQEAIIRYNAGQPIWGHLCVLQLV